MTTTKRMSSNDNKVKIQNRYLEMIKKVVCLYGISWVGRRKEKSSSKYIINKSEINL